MENCLYCDGDDEGFVNHIPKLRGVNGNAYVIKSPWGSKMIVSLPFGKKVEFEIQYCPMCGKKLNNWRSINNNE